jgi:hypothetical protein
MACGAGFARNWIAVINFDSIVAWSIRNSDWAERKKFGQAQFAQPGVCHLRHRSHDYDTQSCQYVLVDCSSNDAKERAALQQG